MHGNTEEHELLLDLLERTPIGKKTLLEKLLEEKNNWKKLLEKNNWKKKNLLKQKPIEKEHPIGKKKPIEKKKNLSEKKPIEKKKTYCEKKQLKNKTNKKKLIE